MISLFCLPSQFLPESSRRNGLNGALRPLISRTRPLPLTFLYSRRHKTLPCAVQQSEKQSNLEQSVQKQTYSEQNVRKQSAQEASAFGRGRLHPRRLVGLYELERLGVNTRKLNEDSTRNEMAFGSVTGLFVAAVLLPPLLIPGNNFEPAIASVAFALLFAWAVDNLALENRFSSIFLSSIQDQNRVARHEAGHFLCSYLTGVSVEDYSMTYLDAMRAGRPISGLVLAETDDIDAIATIGMGGIAGESLTFGDSEGGGSDIQELSKLLIPNADPLHPPRSVKNMLRWGLLQAATLILDHWTAYEKLSEAMLAKKPISECTDIMEKNVNRIQLLP